MEITYTNIFKDLFYFQLREINRSPVRNTVAGIMLIIIFSCTIIVMGSAGFAGRIILAVVVCLLLVCLVTCVDIIGCLFFCKSKKNKTFFTEHTVKFVEEGIFEENVYGKSQLNWTIVQSIRRNKKYIYLYFAQSKAVVIPNSVFADDTKRDEFYNHINSLWKKYSEEASN